MNNISFTSELLSVKSIWKKYYNKIRYCDKRRIGSIAISKHDVETTISLFRSNNIIVPNFLTTICNLKFYGFTLTYVKIFAVTRNNVIEVLNILDRLNIKTPTNELRFIPLS